MEEIPILRCPTGIEGFDNLVEGGFVGGSSVLLTGGTGCGKTTFGMQFLYNGAVKYGEPGVYISFEQHPKDIIRDCSRYGWDLQSCINKGLLEMSFIEPYSFEEFSTIIEDSIRASKAKRLVVDSTSVFGLYLRDEHDVRKKIFELLRLVRKTECTTLLISEILEDSKGLSRFGVEEFVSDGVVVMYYLGIGTETHRSLMVRKMRGTDHDEDIHPIEFGKGGITVKSKDALYTMQQ